MVLNDLVYIFKVGQIIGVRDYCGLLDARIALKGKALGIYCSFVFVITIWQLIIYLIKSILFLYRKLGRGWIEDTESRPWRRSRSMRKGCNMGRKNGNDVHKEHLI